MEFTKRGVLIGMFIFLLVLILLFIWIVYYTGLPDPVDKMYINANVITMVKEYDIASTIGIRGDKIAIVGTRDEANRFIGRKTKIIDLKGKTVLPGFIDCSSQFPYSGYVTNGAVDVSPPPLGNKSTVSEILSALQIAVNNAEPNEWIVGFGYDPNFLPDGQQLDRVQLDTLSDTNPIWVIGRAGNIGVANSIVLNKAGVTNDSTNLPGGLIVRDNGIATGLLLMTEAFKVNRLIPLPAVENNLEAAKNASIEYSKAGVTTVQNGFADQFTLQLLNAASQKGFVKNRIVIYPNIQTTNRLLAGTLKPNVDGVLVRIGATKMILDGSIQAYTAYLKEPYKVQPDYGIPDYKGFLGMELDTFRTLFFQYHEDGLQVAVDATGDATIKSLIDTIGEAQLLLPRDDARHVIIHSEMLTTQDLARLDNIATLPSFFVRSMFYWGDFYEDTYLGQDRTNDIDILRTAENAEQLFTLNNSTPVTPMNIIGLIWSAVNRQTLTGKTINASERISVYSALEAVTINAAYQNFMESEVGTLQQDKYADLVILDKNPLTMNPQELNTINIVETIVAGDTVYQN